MTTPTNGLQPAYQFEDLTLDVAQRRVARRGRPIEIAGLNLDLLKILVESAPNVVTYDDLAEKVWGRHFVSPENVAQRVMLLRQSLSDDASQPRYIETVRNKGYRLIPSVQTMPTERPRETPSQRRRLVLTAAALLAALGLAATGLYWRDTALRSTATLAATTLPNSIAILPFDNLSPDPEDAYFAVGIHEEIIVRLAKIRTINVIARTSVQGYANGDTPIRQIADETNVETVMEGSVRYSGERVRIAANLIDAATGASRWSDVYDRELVDVFAIQEDIAVNIAAALGAEFSPLQRQDIQAQATTSPEAAALYLKVLGLRRETSLVSATHHLYLDQALSFDPEFANAYALKAAAYAISVVDSAGGRADMDPAALETLALENANKALELDPNSALAYLAIAEVHRFHWRWSDASTSYAKAYQLSPNDIDVVSGYAEFLSWIGNHEKAIRLREHAVRLDPASAVRRWGLGIVLGQAGRTAAAAAVLREAVAMAPDVPSIRRWLGQMEAILGNRAAALTELRTTERLRTGVVPWSPTILAGLQYSYSRIDQTEDVARLFGELESAAADAPLGAGTWALAYLGLGDSDQALHWLRIAVEKIANHEPDAGFGNLVYTIKPNLHADPVLDEPRFRELRDKIGALD
jgi:TolB-like protein/DNA-binding winged helix-turn-helix (wHTH) protein